MMEPVTSDRLAWSGPVVAYFSMEIGLASDVPTYAGGLGVLAGDTLRAAADLGIPMVGVTLLHRKGYFRQRLDAAGNQTEEPVGWSPEERLDEVGPRIELELEGRPVRIRAWRYRIHGESGAALPVFLLDTDLAENEPRDREITDHLYGGDERCRLMQNAVLGLGGIAMLRALGYDAVRVHHMNEGHSSLLALAILEDELAATGAAGVTAGAVEAVRRSCVFTTHTPVPAGHDQFPMPMVREVLGRRRAELLRETGGCLEDRLNTTHLALHLSRWVNGVAMRHRQVSRGMFPGYPIDSITNGVHTPTWTSQPFRELFDRHIPEWRRDPFNLRYAVGISPDEIRLAHRESKADLLREVERRTGARLDPDVLTIGFARRATPYKRATLLFSDLDRLRRIATEVGPVQVLYAGKAHSRDAGGKALIRRVFAAAAELREHVPVFYLEDYDMELAARMVSGVDLWLNTPKAPQEASGTSGMKAALNGVPSFSVLDGWWVEGHVEGVTGWSIGDGPPVDPADDAREAASLYDKLERTIVPLFYGRPDQFAEVMRAAISLNGSFFNAHRMLFQYGVGAYDLAGQVVEPGRVAPVTA